MRMLMSLKLLVFAILSVICSYQLYNLDEDPYEASTLMSTEYASELSGMEDACGYWKNLVIEPQLPDTTGNTAAWTTCGGICPWLESDYVPLDVQRKYDYENAPHIVFVLVDDWGYNYAGFQSTFLSWTTPTIDNLAQNGIKLSNYFTSTSCVPARAAFLTGRYPLRTGMWATGDSGDLPLSEVTIAQEMKSAGYKTYLAGKWHMGYSSNASIPTSRGFDYFYGYLNGFVDYYTKQYGTHLDLQDGDTLVTNPEEITSNLHNGYLIETKAEEFIAFHSANYPDDPMFLYYAMQLVHSPFEAPSVYTDRCATMSGLAAESQQDDYYQHEELSLCGMNLMMDEAVANLTCALDAHGMSSNTVLIVVGDNGADKLINGGSYPYRGAKGSTYRGGVSVNCIIHSQLIDEDRRGSTYDGVVHVTDWLPTLMSLATNGEWTGSLSGADLDGYDVFDAIVMNEDSPRTEIAHYVDMDGTCSYQLGMMKLEKGTSAPSVSEPDYYFASDLHPEYESFSCEDTTLTLADTTSTSSTSTSSSRSDSIINSDASSAGGAFIVGFIVIVLVVCLFTGVVTMSLRSLKLWSNDINKYSEIPTNECDVEALI